MADVGLKLFEMLLRLKLLGRGLKAKPLTPQVVSYTVTNACNLKCPHCHANAKRASLDELSFEEAAGVITDLATLGTEVLIFSGGEPLLRKKFVLKLAEYCSDLGIIPAMLTNGTLLDYKTALELKNAGILAVGIPIDYADPKRHDEFRGLPGSFEKAIKAIQACLNADLKVIATIMAMKSNFEEIPKILNSLSKMEVEDVVFYDFVAIGRGRNLTDVTLSKTQWNKLFRRVYKAHVDLDIFSIFSGGDPLYPGLMIEMHKKYGTKPPEKLLRQFLIHSRIGCHAALHYFNIRSNGDIYPCPFLQINSGNIRKQRISDIWYNSKIFNMLRNRNLLKGKCGECLYRDFCGGCRARAYVYTGDPLESDPNCPLELFSKEGLHPISIKEFGLCVG